MKFKKMIMITLYVFNVWVICWFPSTIFSWHVRSALMSLSKNSVHISQSVMSDSLWPHGLQRTRLPGPSPSPTAYSNSCPSSQWFHATISFSVIHFFSCLQSFPASRYFPMSQFFAWGGQSIGASPSVNEYSLMNEHFHEYSGLISFRINWFDLLAVQGILKSLLQHHSSKASVLWCSDFFIVQLSHPYLTPGKKGVFFALTLTLFWLDGPLLAK